MNVLHRRIVTSALFLATVTYGQTTLRLKTGNLRQTAELAPIAERGHRIIQFDAAPSQEVIAALAERGVRVLADVPDNALLVSVDASAEFRPIELRDLGARFTSVLRADDKVSPLAGGHQYFVVEFHKDVDMAEARGLILNQGVELFENPDLSSHHVMIHVAGTERGTRALNRLAGLDQIAYLFPASEELVRGMFVVPCAGAVSTNGTAGQLISTYGEGWDGAGRNATTLNYVLGQMTNKVGAGVAQAEIVKALNEWSKVINLTWQAGSNATATRTINIFFGAGAHGDAYAFDGPGRVLGHTFYPANPNPEPIAGDMHLDEDESWRVGVNIDLFSVALHEMGHGLGLGHSDNPNDVMYPYYRMVTELAAGDKTAILSLYAAAGTGTTPAATPTPNPTPAPTPGPTALTLTVNVPAATTTAASVALSGTVSGGNAPSVTWRSSTGAWGLAQIAGQNWTIANVALALGANNITITAVSGTAQVARTFTITRTQQAQSDTTAPTLTIVSPGQTTVTVSTSALTFVGKATDNVGVTRITWSTNTGASGTASGTTAWSANIPLTTGRNTVTIRAYDAAGNSSWRSISVTRR